jgi:hypothetical protein
MQNEIRKHISFSFVKAKDIVVFLTDNYAAHSSFFAGNSANNFVQVPSNVPVIYGNFFFFRYIIF